MARNLLPLAACLAVMGPARAQEPYPRSWPQPAAGASASGDVELLLTFDDGPDPRNTHAVLDILQARGLRAVFFQVGWRFRRGDVAAAQATEARLIRDGHIVANHTVRHAQLCSTPFELGMLEVSAAREILEEAAAMPVPWFRTPYGARCPRVERLLTAQGLSHFHWDIDPQEWRGLGPKHTAAKVIRALARLEGRGVLLMHDTKYATRIALPLILDWIDAENRRRSREGGRRIRLITGSQLAREQLAPTLDWLAAALGRSRAGVSAALVATTP